MLQQLAENWACLCCKPAAQIRPMHLASRTGDLVKFAGHAFQGMAGVQSKGAPTSPVSVLTQLAGRFDLCRPCRLPPPLLGSWQDNGVVTIFEKDEKEFYRRARAFTIENNPVRVK